MVITVASTKGGVGKSTIAVNLAVEAAKDGKRVLLVDSDIQGSSIGFRAAREKDDIKAMSIITNTLHRDLRDFQNFNYIIVDVGGRDTGVFRSALLAADMVIIPVLPSQYDIWAAADNVENIRLARVVKEFKAYFLFNQVIQGTKISGEATAALEEIIGEDGIKLMESQLVSRVAYKNSISKGLGVSEYEPNGKAASEIHALYNEIKGA
ncbi:MAG TPA: ParA family partition ATPase [Syntrophorhabdaceae bacterium]|nr:ParA family partition ATPase [Syntrophorhabdaceae bacterium]